MTASKRKSLIKCDGKGCSKKDNCVRFSLNPQEAKLKTKNCIGLGFDLFIKKELAKPNAKIIRTIRKAL